MLGKGRYQRFFADTVLRKAFVANRIRKMYNGYNYKEWR